MRLIYTLFFCLFTFIAFNQDTNYNFDSSPYLTSTSTTTNTTNSNVTISSGSISTNIAYGSYFPNEPYIQGNSGWGQSSQAAAKEFCYTVTPSSGFDMTITNLKYQAYATGAGPSVTGYTIGSTSYSAPNLPSGGSITQIDDAISDQLSLTVSTDICIQGWDNNSRSTSGGGDFRVDEFELTLTTSVILPITLTNFEAQTSNNSVELSWTTASEINNDHFEILHSVDGRKYETLDFVDGLGNSNTLKSYTFEHKNAKAGDHYYQLRQVDFDGRSEVFGPVHAAVQRGRADFSPTTIDQTIYFSNDLIGSDYTIFNTAGATIQSGIVSEQVDVSIINKGIYLMRVNNTTHKIIKM